MIKEIRLTHEVARNSAINLIKQLPVDSEHPLRVIVDEDNRTNAQNNKMWVVLTCLEKQVIWDNEKLTKEEWKDMITAAIKGQKARRGTRGGLVFTGMSTRKMSKKAIADVITEAEVFGSENGVNWSDDAHTSFKWVELYKDEIAKAEAKKNKQVA